MTPKEFIGEWRDNPLKERASYQLHFIDLRALVSVEHPSPATAETYCFERGLDPTGMAAATPDDETAMPVPLSSILPMNLKPAAVLLPSPACGESAARGAEPAGGEGAGAAINLLLCQHPLPNPPPQAGEGVNVKSLLTFEADLKKRTLTNLYNARPAWLDNAHKTLDAAVTQAYGWHDYTQQMPDEKILRRWKRIASRENYKQFFEAAACKRVKAKV